MKAFNEKKEKLEKKITQPSQFESFGNGIQNNNEK